MKSDRLKRPAHPKSGLVPWSRGKHNDWAYHRGLELREDDGLLTHARARAFLENVAISKARGGLPAPGFFDCGRRLGRFAGGGQDGRTFHTAEPNAIFTR